LSEQQKAGALTEDAGFLLFRPMNLIKGAALFVPI
jgi:hypothetical protein